MRSSISITLTRKEDLHLLREKSKEAGIAPSEWCKRAVLEALKQGTVAAELTPKPLTEAERRAGLERMNGMLDQWNKEPLVVPEQGVGGLTVRELMEAAISQSESTIGQAAPCPTCLGSRWVCIHCDKPSEFCYCDENGSRNLAPCPRCLTVPKSTIGQRRSWAAEFEAMESMTPEEKRVRTQDLMAGRKPPEGFRDWSRAERVVWLDREWPL